MPEKIMYVAPSYLILDSIFDDILEKERENIEKVMKQARKILFKNGDEIRGYILPERENGFDFDRVRGIAGNYFTQIRCWIAQGADPEVDVYIYSRLKQ